MSNSALLLLNRCFINHSGRALAMTSLLVAIGCSDSDTSTSVVAGVGGNTLGSAGHSSKAGSNGGAGAIATNGTKSGNGGSTARPASGVMPAKGGASGAVVGAGGAFIPGGGRTGAASAVAGGVAQAGSPTARGGAPASFGGANSGGNAAGGNVAAAGGTTALSTEATCPFPSSFKWTDSGPIATPGNNWVSLKDFSSVVHNGKHVVYMSMHDQKEYGSAVMSFSDWSSAATATQTRMNTSTVAPTIFYFAPKKLWVLAYQWCAAKFCYATATDPTSPNSWSFGHPLLNENIVTNSDTGPIDQTVICDSKNCYLFYAGDNGQIYRASMPIGSFPGVFTGSKSIMNESKSNLFEAVQVYTLKGTGKYLMIVEAMGSLGRFFRAFTAPSLDGKFTEVAGAATENSPFAGRKNVTIKNAWTNDISHGDLVRASADETQTVDPCNLQLLYQGYDPKFNGAYDLKPYRPGLLTMAK